MKLFFTFKRAISTICKNYNKNFLVKIFKTEVDSENWTDIPLLLYYNLE